MLPDGFGIESAAATPGVPTFTPAELHKQLDVVLGKGASGTVYSLRDFPGLAAKEVRLDGLGASALQSLRFELATLTTFSHPGILRYHQIIEDEDGNLIHIVMDRHDTSLETLITKHRRGREPVSAETIIALAAQIAGALAYLHGFCGTDVDGRPYQGIVHRDLKPDNVLMSEDGSRVVIADFGLCKDALRSGSTFAGTPLYMAPETLVYNSTSPASDIWALGVIIYELAALKRPNFLEGKEPKDVFINGWKPDLSPVKDDSIRGILERIFVLDQEKRPTARDLCELLQVSDASVVGMKLRVMVLEEALNKANGRIAALEEELQTKSSDICALKNTITTQTAEIDSLKSELKTNAIKIGALEQQFTRAIEALEKKTHRRETEMDQQLAQVRAEADQHKKELDEALKGANNEIASLEKELATKSARVDALEQHLSDKDKKNRDGETALMIAARREHEDIVEFLDPTDENGVTALMRVASRGDAKMVKLLIPIQKGKKMMGDAYINGLQIRSGGTALMWASRYGHPGCVRLLLEKEGGMQDDTGRTALMYAAERNHVDCVQLLLEKETGMRDKGGWTALMRAAQNGHAECARLLARKEKDMRTTREWNGYPPGTAALDIARKGCHTAIASILRG